MFTKRRAVLRGVAIFLLVLIIAGGAGAGGLWLWAYHHFRAAGQALERHRLSDAREHIRLCLIVWPNSDEAHFLAGRAARRALDFKHAEEHFREYQRLLGKTPGLMLEETLIQVQ